MAKRKKRATARKTKPRRATKKAVKRAVGGKSQRTAKKVTAKKSVKRRVGRKSPGTSRKVAAKTVKKRASPRKRQQTEEMIPVVQSELSTWLMSRFLVSCALRKSSRPASRCRIWTTTTLRSDGAALSAKQPHHPINCAIDLIWMRRPKSHRCDESENEKHLAHTASPDTFANWRVYHIHDRKRPRVANGGTRTKRGCSGSIIANRKQPSGLVVYTASQTAGVIYEWRTRQSWSQSDRQARRQSRQDATIDASYQPNAIRRRAWHYVPASPKI